MIVWILYDIVGFMTCTKVYTAEISIFLKIYEILSYILLIHTFDNLKSLISSQPVNFTMGCDPSFYSGLSGEYCVEISASNQLKILHFYFTFL